jgi:hypothetical protein
VEEKSPHIILERLALPISTPLDAVLRQEEDAIRVPARAGNTMPLIQSYIVALGAIPFSAERKKTFGP